MLTHCLSVLAKLVLSCHLVSEYSCISIIIVISPGDK